MSVQKPLAVVTGASSGIGFELAKIAAENGFDLIVVADTPLDRIVDESRALGARVAFAELDLALGEGVDQLLSLIGNQPVDALFANAGHGLGQAFLDQDFEDIMHVVNTNISGTLYLLHEIGRQMRRNGRGRILVTGSIAGYQPEATKPSTTPRRHSSIRSHWLCGKSSRTPA